MAKTGGMDLKKPWATAALIERFEQHRNGKLASPMANYMKDNFPFLGIQTPLRKTLLKQLLETHALPEQERLQESVWELYAQPEREFHYAAIALLEKSVTQLSPEDLPFLRRLIEIHPWWDSVDPITTRLVGPVVLKDRRTGNRVMQQWADSPNTWLNRSAILHQLKFKEETDPALLQEVIVKHIASDEFFIQKAIGWALREYAKTDPKWVSTFASRYPLKPLSKREALKNIQKPGPP